MRYFDDANIRTQVNIEFANFSGRREDFDDADSLRDRSKMDAKSWWIVLGTHAPTLQKIALSYLDNHVLLLVVKEIGVPTLSYIL